MKHNEYTETEDDLGAARGCIIAAPIALTLWGAIAVVIVLIAAVLR